MAGMGGGEGVVLGERDHDQSQKATKGLGASGTSADAEPHTHFTHGCALAEAASHFAAGREHCTLRPWTTALASLKMLRTEHPVLYATLSAVRHHESVAG
jgi:hypothetical protein